MFVKNQCLRKICLLLKIVTGGMGGGGWKLNFALRSFEKVGRTIIEWHFECLDEHSRKLEKIKFQSTCCLQTSKNKVIKVFSLSSWFSEWSD